MPNNLPERIPNPRAFISYSRESNNHIESVVRLADRLLADGVDCHLDEYEVAPHQGWQRWMEQQVRQADFVLIICTALYRSHFDGVSEPGRGLGVAWERSVITAELYRQAGHNEKFLPVLFASSNCEYIPDVLSSTTYYDLGDDDGYERLLRRLTRQPRRIKPPVGPIKSLPPLGPRSEGNPPPYSEKDMQVVVDIVAERVQFLSPGVLPRIGKGDTIDVAIHQGTSGDAATRVFRALCDERILIHSGLVDTDEFIVDRDRLEAIRDRPRPLGSVQHTDLASGQYAELRQTQISINPVFRCRFRSNDSAGEPNYYVELGLTNEVPIGTARFVCLYYTPRNGWDDRGGVWPVNVHHNRDLGVLASSLSQDNYSTLLTHLPEKVFPGFHLVGGIEFRLGNTPLLPNDHLLLSTLEVFGPDLILDWRLDTPVGSSTGTERLARPSDKSLPLRFTLRSRLRLGVRNSRVVPTHDGDRIECDVMALDYDFGVQSSCWAEVISQWGQDLAARLLIKEALEPAMLKVQQLKAAASRRVAVYEREGTGEVIDAERHADEKRQFLALERLEYQLALETPIRLDDFYARVLDHYRSQNDHERLPHLRDEWALAISRTVSHVPVPMLDGEIT